VDQRAATLQPALRQMPWANEQASSNRARSIRLLATTRSRIGEAFSKGLDGVSTRCAPVTRPRTARTGAPRLQAGEE
jgi:hypothetical protein